MGFFEYFQKPLTRRHGPSGYTNYRAYKPWLRDDFIFQCAYCLIREKHSPTGVNDFVVDHFLPRKDEPHLECTYDNLVYSCHKCNSYKGKKRDVLDPTAIGYGEHLKVQSTGLIRPLTRQGKKLIKVFSLNDQPRVAFRKLLLEIYNESDKTSDKFKKWFGFPEDLPDLKRLKPPRNTKPEGIEQSHFERRKRGELPDIY